MIIYSIFIDDRVLILSLTIINDRYVCYFTILFILLNIIVNDIKIIFINYIFLYREYNDYLENNYD
jgi:hypothetical protein